MTTSDRAAPSTPIASAPAAPALAVPASNAPVSNARNSNAQNSDAQASSLPPTGTSAPGTAIAVFGLHKSFGDHHVLDGVDLTVPAGTVYALLGPNGAGKTTMVNILSTLLTADAGDVRVAGHDVRREPARVRSAIGVTVLLTTQYLEEADALADRVGVLDAGTLVAEGTPAELKALVPGDSTNLDDVFLALTGHAASAADATHTTDPAAKEATAR